MQHQSNPSVSVVNPSVSVVAEQRRLFGHGRHSKRPRPSGNSLSKSKRGATCTLKFVCLAFKEEADRPPLSVKERTALANAGLGDASITFGINKNSGYEMKVVVVLTLYFYPASYPSFVLSNLPRASITQ